jgi:CRISPR-associated exonuclease Cas4
MDGGFLEYMIQIIILCIILIAVLYALRPAMTVIHKRVKGQKFAKMIYADEKGAKLLYAPQSDLQGKPDFIFKTWFLGRYIPFEIKSATLKEDEPHQGDLMQLAAYFLIIEEVYGKKPPYGKLVYENKTFKVRNTRALRNELDNILWEMRKMLEGETYARVEPSFIKCKNCICKYTVCEWNEDTKEH